MSTYYSKTAGKQSNRKVDVQPPVCHHLLPPDLCKFYVGGKRYVTTIATLHRGGLENLLYILCSQPSYPLLGVRYYKGCPFFDRSGTSFDLLFEYLLDGRLPESDSQLQRLLSEALYFNITVELPPAPLASTSTLVEAVQPVSMKIRDLPVTYTWITGDKLYPQDIAKVFRNTDPRVVFYEAPTSQVQSIADVFLFCPATGRLDEELPSAAKRVLSLHRSPLRTKKISLMMMSLMD